MAMALGTIGQASTPLCSQRVRLGFDPMVESESGFGLGSRSRSYCSFVSARDGWMDGWMDEWMDQGNEPTATKAFVRWFVGSFLTRPNG